jgi:hypothetical protein
MPDNIMFINSSVLSAKVANSFVNPVLSTGTLWRRGVAAPSYWGQR